MLQLTWNNFLGDSPRWYKQSILFFLLLNPVLFWWVSPVVAGWALLLQFIYTLAMSLRCYPLQPGGLLTLEAVLLGMTTSEHIYREVVHNFEVILLLIFMVAAIFFMRDLLLIIFTRLLLGFRSRVLRAFCVVFMSAFLSAFLDALTVTAVLISMGVGFYAIYDAVARGRPFHHMEERRDEEIAAEYREDLQQFRAFLRGLLMHGIVGTALGGVCTLVGEPQNLLIAERMGWHFMEFFLQMAPVTMPVLVVGLGCCMLLEKTRVFGYGAQLPASVREIIAERDREAMAALSGKQRNALWMQGICIVLLILALGFHVAPVGLIGLALMVLLTASNGIVAEHRLGRAFEESLPFTALLVVFFAVVAIIHDQGLFSPIFQYILTLQGAERSSVFYLATGLLSMISDNVFVATIYINEASETMRSGLISRSEYENIAVVINTGTNIPSIATPNGQAAFLFLLTSALAPLIRLSYGRMVWMALPYMLLTSSAGLLAIIFILH